MKILTYTTSHKDTLRLQSTKDPIFLITQFFIHKDKNRDKEIKECLLKNIHLGLFHNIYLLNEKIYSQQELGLNKEEMKYITQIDLKKRLSYKDFFTFSNNLNVKGYFVLANSDIFFDTSIINLRKSCLSHTKSMYTLIRFEYDKNKPTIYSPLFLVGKEGKKKPIPGAQDTWIYHSNFKPNTFLLQDSDILLGKPGCDNTIAYLLTIHGYKCINEPWNVRTYHNHKTQIRDYVCGKDTIKKSHYLFPIPIEKK